MSSFHGQATLKGSSQSEHSVALGRKIDVKLRKFHYFSSSIGRENPEEIHRRLNLYNMSRQVDNKAHFDFHVVPLGDLEAVPERGCSTLRRGAFALLQWYRFGHGCHRFRR